MMMMTMMMVDVYVFTRRLQSIGSLEKIDYRARHAGILIVNEKGEYEQCELLRNNDNSARFGFTKTLQQIPEDEYNFVRVGRTNMTREQIQLHLNEYPHSSYDAFSTNCRTFVDYIIPLITLEKVWSGDSVVDFADNIYKCGLSHVQLPPFPTQFDSWKHVRSMAELSPFSQIVFVVNEGKHSGKFLGCSPLIAHRRLHILNHQHLHTTSSFNHNNGSNSEGGSGSGGCEVINLQPPEEAVCLVGEEGGGCFWLYYIMAGRYLTNHKFGDNDGLTANAKSVGKREMFQFWFGENGNGDMKLKTEDIWGWRYVGFAKRDGVCSVQRNKSPEISFLLFMKVVPHLSH